jgi:hypothetical protein
MNLAKLSYLCRLAGQRSANQAILLVCLFCSPLLNAAAQHAFQLSGRTADWPSVDAGQVYFRENKGQVRDQHQNPRADVLYSGEAEGLHYHLKADGLHYQLSRVERWGKETCRNSLSAGLQGIEQNEPIETSIWRVDVDWAGARAETCIEPSEALPGYEHFYNVPPGSEPALFVKRYQSLTYHDLYPGIDLRFYKGSHGGLEYDFIVRPEADYRQIRLSIRGADLSVDAEERLILATPLGKIAEGSLYVHQEGKPVAASWVIHGNEAGIALGGPYDSSKALIIDPPVLVWGTYFGGSGNDRGHACTLDGDNNLYLAGETNSIANIATAGAHQFDYGGGNMDAFLAKFNHSGERVWSTYYGGSDPDIGADCAVDENGMVYLAGRTLSAQNIATAGAHQEHYGGAADAFLAKFDQDGLRQWGTYYGDFHLEDNVLCAVSKTGAVFLAGLTYSDENIATPGTHLENIPSAVAAFLIKFDSEGNRQWGTYFGGNSLPEPYACAADQQGNIYLAGTTSDMGVATPGAHQENLGGDTDAFLAKFNPEGNLLWATYYGGESFDNGRSCAVGLAEKCI